MSNSGNKQILQLRPRFEVKSDLSPHAILSLIKEHNALQTSDYIIDARLGYLTIYPRHEIHHYWSPHLSVIIEESEDNGSLLKGHYGPSPKVWTLFILVYAFLTLLVTSFLVIGFANQSIGGPTGILWLVPILILIIISMYLSSYFGQRKGHAQREKIHYLLEEILATKLTS